jgi:hypothetical protein
VAIVDAVRMVSWIWFSFQHALQYA